MSCDHKYIMLNTYKSMMSYPYEFLTLFDYKFFGCRSTCIRSSGASYPVQSTLRKELSPAKHPIHTHERSTTPEESLEIKLQDSFRSCSSSLWRLAQSSRSSSSGIHRFDVRERQTSDSPGSGESRSQLLQAGPGRARIKAGVAARA